MLLNKNPDIVTEGHLFVWMPLSYFLIFIYLFIHLFAVKHWHLHAVHGFYCLL